MVKWKPHGEIPPMNQKEWEAEFEDFKQYPEYQMKRKYENFTLDEFKFIYFMEWSHRMAGRALGIAFAVPFAYFAVRGRIKGDLRGRLAVLFALGGAQGLVGWWMVKSGLEKNVKVDTAEAWQLNTQFAAVSPYRLTSHFTAAIILYVALLSTGFGLMYKGRLATASAETRSKLSSLLMVSHLTAGVVGVTAVSGGFVAGNHAGLAYNDWPLMGGRFIPADIWDSQLGVRNLFENIPTVQFNHRMLAYTSILGTVVLTLKARRLALPPHAKRAVLGVVAAVGGQVTLGVCTLLFGVPVSLAAMHQVGSLIVLTAYTWLIHALRLAPLLL